MKKSEVTIKRILINIAIIGAIILAITIASHFFLRSGTRHGAHCTVPEFKGLSLSDAQTLAKSQGLNLYINDSLYVASYEGGAVLDQLPAGGVEVKPGRTVYIIINAFGDKMVKIPYVAGHSLRQAKNILEVAGLEIAKINYVQDMATNYVLESSYKGRTISEESNAEAVMGDGITLKVGVSSSDPYTITPNVIGLSLREAKSRIWEAGLNIGNVNVDKGVNLLRDKSARVYLQGVAANQSAGWGSRLSIRLTNDDKKIQEAVIESVKADREYEKMLLEQADSLSGVTIEEKIND